MLKRLFATKSAHRDLASRIHVRNGAERGQTRTDVNDPKATSSAVRTEWIAEWGVNDPT